MDRSDFDLDSGSGRSSTPFAARFASIQLDNAARNTLEYRFDPAAFGAQQSFGPGQAAAHLCGGRLRRQPPFSV